MGGLKISAIIRNQYPDPKRCFSIIVIILVINASCNAYFYSEKKSSVGEDRNCFCEVKIICINWLASIKFKKKNMLMRCYLEHAYLIYFTLINFFFVSASIFKIQLKGSIDDCSCNIDTVDYFNNNKIHPRLKSLLVRDFFRYFKVNLKKDCPFWPDDSKCAMRSCHVSPCEEKDIPEGLKGRHQQESFVYKVKIHMKNKNSLNIEVETYSFSNNVIVIFVRLH